MGVGVFARLQHTPGIRQWDPRAENWVLICASIWDPQSESGSRSPAIAFRKWEACATARSVPRGSDACHNCSVALSLRAPVQERSPCPSALPLKLRPNALSPEVLGMAHCLDSPSQSPRTFGAYCFKLNFTPVAVIANSIAHPNDSEF